MRTLPKAREELRLMDARHTEVPARKPYSRPVLSVFGDMKDLTLNNVSNNKNDTMSGSATRT
jgi:hypothetical protein